MIAASLIAVVVVVGAIGAVKAAQIGAMIEAGSSFVPPPIGVSTAEAESSEWESSSSAIGTAVATQEVMIASEVPGTVRSLRFDSGEEVRRGQVLVTLDSSTERAQLASAQAEAQLAAINLRRMEELVGRGAVSQSDLDTARARKAQADASIAGLRATIAKKTLRAPFAGRLGIREVDLGEVLQPGTPIVSLQSLSEIYVEFQVPEQTLSQLQVGLAVRATSDAFPDEVLTGTIHTIDSRVDEATRNIRVRALVPNEGERIRPGMFLEVDVVQPQVRQVLAVPNTSVLYAPYGDSVYVVDEGEGGTLQARQVFVRLGERRGDLVAVESGLEAGQTVVTTGAFKLQNGAAVTVNNEVTPPDAVADPNPENR
ncbi:MAG: efflux RND transporter periplasmic adaptor subunit [Myxococcota bacterium]